MPEERLRGICEPNARREIFKVSISKNGIRAVNVSTRLPRRTWVGGGQRQVRLCVMCFITRSVNVIPEAQIQGQILSELKIILYKGREIVGVPSRIHRVDRQAGLLRRSQHKAGKGISGRRVILRERRLIRRKCITRRSEGLA